jgi:MerR family transcriptional regulator/heat shock protein HspR
MIVPTPAGANEDTPVFVISVAAQLAGMHAQTLRSYDRMGLVSPGRSPGGGRRYSVRDIALLQEVQRLSQNHGVNLAGIKRIIELENQVETLHARLAELVAELEEAHTQLAAAHTAAEQAAAAVHASYRRDLVPVRPSEQAALLVWRPSPRPR